MILITVIYIADLIMSIQPIEEMPEMIEQTARLILRS